MSDSSTSTRPRNKATPPNSHIDTESQRALINALFDIGCKLEVCLNHPELKSNPALHSLDKSLQSVCSEAFELVTEKTMQLDIEAELRGAA